jgi:hypothetical protein
VARVIDHRPYDETKTFQIAAVQSRRSGARLLRDRNMNERITPRGCVAVAVHKARKNDRADPGKNPVEIVLGHTAREIADIKMHMCLTQQ